MRELDTMQSLLIDRVRAAAGRGEPTWPRSSNPTGAVSTWRCTTIWSMSSPDIRRAMRLGKQRAIRWTDVDFELARVYVRRSLRSDSRQSPSLRSDGAQVNRNTRPDHAGTAAQIDRNT